MVRLGLIAVVLVAACEHAPEAESSDPPADDANPPAWLSLEPNHRREESSRLANQAIADCSQQVPLDTLRAAMDSILSHYGIEPGEARSHPEAARQLDLLLERQDERRACLDVSPELQRSRMIMEEAPDAYDLPVYDSPDSTSERVGIVHIARDESAPGPHRLLLTFRQSEETATEWVSDRRQVDGYGGYYHTVLERTGDWLLLPADPFPTPVWVHWRSTFHSPPEIEPLFDQVYQMTEVEAEIAGLEPPRSPDAPGIVFVRSGDDRIWFRIEGPEDGPCPELRSQNPAETRPAGESREYPLDIDRLLDDRGHLRLDVKYWRGC